MAELNQLYILYTLFDETLNVPLWLHFFTVASFSQMRPKNFNNNNDLYGILVDCYDSKITTVYNTNKLPVDVNGLDNLGQNQVDLDPWIFFKIPVLSGVKGLGILFTFGAPINKHC